MGIPVLILGESGSGKSSSLRNFTKDEVVIYNIAGKPLPFRNGATLNCANNVSYNKILANMKKAAYKRYVIDDSQYLLCFELFDRVKENGYTKYVDMALHFYQLIQFIVREMPPDCIVYFLHHVESVDGRLKAKTVGRMLDEKLTVEGLFSIVLMADIIDGEHVFITASNGQNTVKTPMEMFADERIDNDLKEVDTVIRQYYNLKGNE